MYRVLPVAIVDYVKYENWIRVVRHFFVHLFGSYWIYFLSLLRKT